MKMINTHRLHPTLTTLRRNPMLTVLLVYSFGFALAAVIAILAGASADDCRLTFQSTDSREPLCIKYY
jgi:hypothetical protein